MNLLHLKYAVEVERTGSITRAAEKLYMSQPNLSKAIRELEASLGMSIFKRSSKGIVPTRKGEEFLASARNILAQVEEMEARFEARQADAQRFSISIPRASYIAHAFSRFVGRLDRRQPMEINYSETHSMKTIQNIIEGEFNLGIIRYQTEHERYFFSLLEDKGLKHKPVLEYTYLVLMSREHPLAAQNVVDDTQLQHAIQIVHGDLTTSFHQAPETQKAEPEQRGNRRITVHERGSQYDLLHTVPETYMWASPTPRELLDSYNLVQRSCKNPGPLYKDLLIYPESYRMTEVDQLFLQELYAVRDEITAPEE